MLDLFEEPVLPGLHFADEFLGIDDEAALISRIDALDLTPFRFQGWEGKRLTSSFGLRYDFDQGVLATADPMPSWLTPIRDRAERFLDLPGVLQQALLIRYDPGAGIGWHRDRPHFEHVVGVSLGAPATLRLRRKVNGRFERRAIPLAPRGIYHLRDEARHVWEHSILPLPATRWSITFRSLSEKGRRLMRIA